MRVFAIVAAVALIAGSSQAATLEAEPTPGADLGASVPERFFEKPTSGLAAVSFLENATSPNLIVAANRYSGLPEPSVWGMLIAGFGAAGSVMRRRARQTTYRLEECAPQGITLTEEFAAPDDASALSRATSVVSGDFKLWRGEVLVQG